MKTLRGALAALTVVTVFLALAGVAAGGDGDGTKGGGLDGHTVEFRVTSKDSPTACVSFYETTGKNGPAKYFDRVTTQLVDLPWEDQVGTGSKVGHWMLATWATDDCASTADVVGAVRCTIKVDGKRKTRVKGTDHALFCPI
jgi:hypothetical protein